MMWRRTLATILAIAATCALSVVAYRFPVSGTSGAKALWPPVEEMFSFSSAIATPPIVPLLPPESDTPLKPAPDLSPLLTMDHTRIWSDWTLPWEPSYREQWAVPDTSFNFLSNSLYQRDPNSAVRTLSPMTLNVYQPLDVGTWQTFRPILSAGVGVLSQSMESREYQDPQREMRALLHFGIGAEWSPTDRLLFRMGYDYFQLPVGSSLNPNMPERDHALSLGVEIKF